jgi:prolipoprotein diacylglyceryltransferase
VIKENVQARLLDILAVIAAVCVLALLYRFGSYMNSKNWGRAIEYKEVKVLKVRKVWVYNKAITCIQTEPDGFIYSVRKEDEIRINNFVEAPRTYKFTIVWWDTDPLSRFIQIAEPVKR